jgi:cation transport ATPase
MTATRATRAGVLAWAGVTLAPAAGAVLMSASTIVVAFNAQLLRRLRLGRTPVEPEPVAQAHPAAA